MKLIFYLTILILIYNNECFITNYKNKEYVYKFFNTITASNNASDKVLSRWAYSGNLIVQEYDDCKIFKLDNIKTSFFNGIRNNIKVNETELSEDKKILTEPFGVYFKSLTDVNISVTPNDQLWSINMKKSIASSFLIDTSLDKGKTDTEQLIFGECGISLETQNSRSTKIIEKTINHKTCLNGPIKQSSNVDGIKNNYNPLQHETKRIYVISKNNCVFSIESSSNFTLQSSPDVRNLNRIEQNQYFELITTKQNTKPFKLHNNTNIKNLIYEYESTETNHTDQNAYLENFLNAYTKFKTYFYQKPAYFWDISAQPPISEMLNNLKKFDSNCLSKLLLGILMGRDTQYYEIFLEILPYAGTKPTINLIKEIVKEDIDLHIKIKLLTIFPEYVKEIDDKTIENFEEFLTIDDVHIKQTAILSFTSLVSTGIKKNTINNEIVEKYVKRFYQKFLDARKHEDKVTYLLGLVNMGSKLPLNAILNIIYNQRESRHIRELAIYGFKNNLKPFGKEFFHKFWEFAKNPNENFETRVAVLDLLLSSEISEEQFYEIANFCEKSDEHLSNYFVTTIISLQNNTGYQHYLGDWATNIFQTRKLRQNLRAWSTGNYRFSFTDKNSNFGLVMQTKLVSDPKTNAINVIQFTLNRFALSMSLGEVHVYLKLEGIIDLMFVKAYLNKRSENPINELINLIQQCKYQMRRRDDLFIDLVVFSDSRALFAIHLDQNNIEAQNTILAKLIQFVQNRKYISYPILNKMKIPSDLGTEIKIKYDMQKVAFREIHNFLELIQSNTTAKITFNAKVLTQMTETLNSINPLLDTKIYVQKLHHNFVTLDLPFSIDKNDNSVSWNYENDIFNWVKENTIYTFIGNNTILKEHCSNCNVIEEILPTVQSKDECIDAAQCRIWREKIIKKYPLGVSVNITSNDEREDVDRLHEIKTQLIEFITSHQGNSLTFPFVKPLLYYLHYNYYKRYLDNHLIKYSARSSVLYNEAYTTKLKLSYNETFINNYDPLDTFNENSTLLLTNTRTKDNYVFSGAKLIFRLASIIEKNDIQTLVNIGNNFTIIADILESENSMKKFCLKHTMFYPNRLSDKLSLEPAKLTKGITTVSFDNVWSFDYECPPYTFKLTEELSINDRYKNNIKNMNEYKTCKKESVGFKYTPSTKSCSIAHNAASMYRDYLVLLEKRNVERNVIFEYHHIDDKTINVEFGPTIRNALKLKRNSEILNYTEPATFANFISTNPTEFLSNFERTCEISGGGVKTFFDEYNPRKQKDTIAFVECTNSTQVGLIVNKIAEINVVFKFWSGQNTISTTIENNQMKLYLNGKEVKENTQNDELKISFIRNDVLYITSDLVELYYSPISLSIQIPTLFYKYLCGECLQ